jgi:large subunit ribosomal protein L3
VAIELLCRKLGMTRIFNEDGEAVPVTVLEAGPNAVLQHRTVERDGYTALQLGFGARRAVTLSKAMVKHFEKAGTAPRRWVAECRVGAEELAKHAVGSEIRADLFQPGQRVDVIGTSKGRGTAGVVRRYHFAMQKWTHGTHEGARRPGSIGANTFPGHVWKGKRMYGRMGNERVTTRNVVVVRVDGAKNLLLVQGAVPGHNQGLVRIRPAVAPKRVAKGGAKAREAAPAEPKKKK